MRRCSKRVWYLPGDMPPESHGFAVCMEKSSRGSDFPQRNDLSQGEKRHRFARSKRGRIRIRRILSIPDAFPGTCFFMDNSVAFRKSSIEWGNERFSVLRSEHSLKRFGSRSPFSYGTELAGRVTVDGIQWDLLSPSSTCTE